MIRQCDTVIVGTGVAGLYSALNLPRSQRIIMLTKAGMEESDSFLAQGGICVLRVQLCPDDLLSGPRLGQDGASGAAYQ